MKANQYFRFVVFIGMITAVCGMAGAAGMGIVAEPHETSGADAPVCNAPCECMSLTQAMERWGTDGYDYCTKTVCGQSADAMVQYYCLHQKGASAAQTVQAQVPAAGAPVAASGTQKSSVGLFTIVTSTGLLLLSAGHLRRK